MLLGQRTANLFSLTALLHSYAAETEMKLGVLWVQLMRSQSAAQSKIKQPSEQEGKP
jgi:hypothetical protein